MKPVFFFLAAFTLFAASAIPMQAAQGSSSASNPDYAPKIHFGYLAMTRNDRTAARDMIINHYKDLEPGDDHRGAVTAFASDEWRDGKNLDDEHRQYLDFDYYRGDTPSSGKIGQSVTVSRDRPPPESHFVNTILPENKAGIAKEMDKKYKALPPEQAMLVRSMKAHGDWGDGPGLREETQMSFYHNVLPKPQNKLWDPVTIHRPMSFLIHDGVPPKEAPAIKKRIRQEHEKLDENHPFKQANYAVVTEGWIKAGKGRSLHVGTTLYKVKDQLSTNAEDDFAKIGYLKVPLGRGQKAEADDPSTGSKKRKGQS